MAEELYTSMRITFMTPCNLSRNRHSFPLLLKNIEVPHWGRGNLIFYVEVRGACAAVRYRRGWRYINTTILQNYKTILQNRKMGSYTVVTL